MMEKQLDYKQYLALAIPFVISTVTQPLLGAVDTAVLGRLDDPAFMGGVAIGAVIFNTMYWLFGFLRVSTSGFSAQSLGTRSEKDSLYAYFRPASIAILIGFIFILLQYPIRQGAMGLFKPDQDVLVSAVTYFNILIWGAPFVLIGYVNLGWLMGRKHVKETLFLQVSTNVLNIILDILFVVVWKQGVYGVAVATLISQIYGFAIGTILISRKLDYKKVFKYSSDIFDKIAYRKIIGVNTDLFIRTICLLTMTNMFVAKGSLFGKDILAANAVLFQIQYILAYLYDGFANAASVYAGKAVGEKDVKAYKNLVKIATVCAVALSGALTIMLMFFVDDMIYLFTNIQEVIVIAMNYRLWLVAFPFVISFGLVYYGIFTGCTYTRAIRNSMIISLVAFIIVYVLATPMLDNHGLWLAFMIFSFSRSIILYLYKNRLEKDVFYSIVKDYK